MINLTQYQDVYERKGKCWTLTDELIYLDGLGFWSRSTRKSRRELLEDYIATAHLRQTSWIRDGVAYAEKLLALEYGG